MNVFVAFILTCPSHHVMKLAVLVAAAPSGGDFSASLVGALFAAGGRLDQGHFSEVSVGGCSPRQEWNPGVSSRLTSKRCHRGQLAFLMQECIRECHNLFADCYFLPFGRVSKPTIAC